MGGLWKGGGKRRKITDVSTFRRRWERRVTADVAVEADGVWGSLSPRSAVDDEAQDERLFNYYQPSVVQDFSKMEIDGEIDVEFNIVTLMLFLRLLMP